MNQVKIPLFSPIRFHDPSLEFDNETTFQNPDNRLSTSYDWENVNNVPYHLPIPKQWPDGQPGIDFMFTVINEGPGVTVFPKIYLYDSNDELYKELDSDLILASGGLYYYRAFGDGISGTGIEDGFYTIKIYNIFGGGNVLMAESEALLIADWFIDCIPFEFWNFENDFGVRWNDGSCIYTSRIMVPIRLYDPIPEFEKEMYKNDPGVLTTLRTVPQRVFNFDSHPLPVHVIELIQLGFSCSELYLDRIKINSEENPEAELYEGTNLKYLTGKASFVDFNDNYTPEIVETERVDQSIDWDTYDIYDPGTITGNSFESTDAVIASFARVYSDTITWDAGDLFLIKITLTDDAGDSDLPAYSFNGNTGSFLDGWGIYWLSFRMYESDSATFRVQHTTGEKAVFTAVIEVYKIV